MFLLPLLMATNGLRLPDNQHQAQLGNEHLSKTGLLRSKRFCSVNESALTGKSKLSFQKPGLYL